MRHYKLDGRQPEPCDDAIEWAKWFSRADRTVKKDMVGDVLVSTVFLGLDLAYSDSPYPILFETMVFGGKLNERQERCGTWTQAEYMHAHVLADVIAAEQGEGE